MFSWIVFCCLISWSPIDLEFWGLPGRQPSDASSCYGRHEYNSFYVPQFGLLSRVR